RGELVVDDLDLGFRAVFDPPDDLEAGDALIGQAAPIGQTARLRWTPEQVRVGAGDKALAGRAEQYARLQRLNIKRENAAPPGAPGAMYGLPLRSDLLATGRKSHECESLKPNGMETDPFPGGGGAKDHG